MDSQDSHSPHLPPRDIARETTMVLNMKRIILAVFFIALALGLGLIGGLLSGKLFDFGITVVERSTPIFVPQDATTTISRIDRKVLGGVLPVYPSSRTKTNDTLANFYITQRDQLGYAIALTHDGWVVSTQDVIANTQAVIGLGQGVFAPVTAIVRDQASNLVFAKLEDVSLLALAFARVDENTRSEVVAIPTTSGPLRAIIIDAVHHYDCASTDCLVQDAQVYDEVGLASPAYHDVALGMPLLTKDAQVLGIVTGVDAQENHIQFTPASFVTPVLDDLFATQQVRRAQLPFSYISLAGLASIDPTVPEQGAMVMRVSQSTSAPAALQVGDVITAVNGIPLSYDQTLSSLLFSYPVGTTVQLQVMRDDGEAIVDMPLLALE